MPTRIKFDIEAFEEIDTNRLTNVEITDILLRGISGFCKIQTQTPVDETAIRLFSQIAAVTLHAAGVRCYKD